MTSALRVVSAGGIGMIQDLGRAGMQRFGVPVSGALDSVSLRIANAVVGNADGTAGLEMFYQGPTLQIEAESVRVAAVGAPLEVLAGEQRRLVPQDRRGGIGRRAGAGPPAAGCADRLRRHQRRASGAGAARAGGGDRWPACAARKLGNLRSNVIPAQASRRRGRAGEEGVTRRFDLAARRQPQGRAASCRSTVQQRLCSVECRTCLLPPPTSSRRC